jgi:hypothetical protein
MNTVVELLFFEYQERPLTITQSQESNKKSLQHRPTDWFNLDNEHTLDGTDPVWVLTSNLRRQFCHQPQFCGMDPVSLFLPR